MSSTKTKYTAWQGRVRALKAPGADRVFDVNRDAEPALMALTMEKAAT
jgi:hypothetical protein